MRSSPARAGLILVAVAVVAIAVWSAVRGDGGRTAAPTDLDPAEIAAAPSSRAEPTTTSPPPDPKQLWGHRWTVVSEARGGVDVSGSLPASRPLVLDTTTTGRVSFRACNTASGAATLEGGRLVTRAVIVTEMACVPTDGGSAGDSLMAHDAVLARLLDADPRVEISSDGQRLTLATRATTLVLRRV